MAMKFAVSEITLKRIDNGYVLKWVQKNKPNPPGYLQPVGFEWETNHEYYNKDLLEIFGKLEEVIKR